jgi:hypothetical protein
MSRSRIDVECYAGARVYERPRRLFIEGREFRVMRLISESIEESADTNERTHRYKVLIEDGVVLEVLHKENGWSLDSEMPTDLNRKT